MSSKLFGWSESWFRAGLVPGLYRFPTLTSPPTDINEAGCCIRYGRCVLVVHSYAGISYISYITAVQNSLSGTQQQVVGWVPMGLTFVIRNELVNAIRG